MELSLSCEIETTALLSPVESLVQLRLAYIPPFYVTFIQVITRSKPELLNLDPRGREREREVEGLRATRIYFTRPTQIAPAFCRSNVVVGYSTAINGWTTTLRNDKVLKSGEGYFFERQSCLRDFMWLCRRVFFS